MTDGVKLKKPKPKGPSDWYAQRFGMLIAILPERNNGRKWYWRYRCDCGKECVKCGADVTKDVRKGRTPNCGCMTAALIGAGNTTHGLTGHKLYAVWRSMNDRCRLPSHQAWANYGGRGIFVCERWKKSFPAFWNDMSPTYAEGLCIDRINNDDGYYPENCRWVGYVPQARNRRGNCHITTPWGVMTVAEASERSGVGRSTIHERIKRGWPLEMLLDGPSFASLTSRTAAPGTGS